MDQVKVFRATVILQPTTANQEITETSREDRTGLRTLPQG
jgi:hypothetical protein